MKAYNILEQAVRLAGGTVPDELLRKTGVSIINTVLTDLKEENIESLTDELSFSESGYFTVLTAGAAMMIAVLWGDDSGAAKFSEVYNSSRKKLLGRVSRVRPTVFGGGENEV